VYSLLARISIFRNVLKKLTRTAVPEQTRVWVDVPAGLGKGLALNLDPRFEMQYASGMYEINLQKALSAYLQPGSVVYDVGAHIGVVSIFAGELVGPTGRVFAFEADPENAKRIETHVQRNDLAQIQVFSCAAWSSSGKLSFERASAHSSRNQGSVSKAPAQTGQDTIVVESIRLDDFAQQHVLPPTLIKIDVEGGEADVLLGCEQIFSRSHPVLICEVHHKQAEEDV
jgi:FkbM family methyltransferase